MKQGLIALVNLAIISWGTIMIKCDVKGCDNRADLIKEKNYYCATCYMRLFLKAISNKKRGKKLKRRIEGQLRHNATEKIQS